MGLVDLFSLSYPADTISQEVFHAKVTRFFSYSVSNMLGLIYGAFLISLVLYIKGTTVELIIVYFFIITIIALIVFFLSLYVENKKPTAHKLQKLLLLRVVLGCCIGLMYGVACFLLPENAAEIGIYFLIMIYLVSISIAIFQYSVIPLYYISFNLSVYIPLSIYLWLNDVSYNSLLILLLVSGMALFVFKGLKVSLSEINSIIVNLELKKEAAEHLETRNKLQEIALYDDLTKAANRYLFKKSAEASLERAKINDRSMALLYIDLNNFKYINDHFGHFVGDKVLIETAEVIRSKVRSSDLVARLGGDEFVVILENYDSAKVNASLINNICDSLNKEIEIDENRINLSASIGIASYPLNGNTVEKILHAADARMYKNKQAIREAGLNQKLLEQSEAQKTS